MDAFRINLDSLSLQREELQGHWKKQPETSSVAFFKVPPLCQVPEDKKPSCS